jgi:hypothetical protein
LNAGTISVVLKAITEQFDRAIDSAGAELKAFQQAAEDAAKVSGAAFLAMSGSLAYALNEFGESEEAMVRLEATARATGNAFDTSRLTAWASALERATGFSDDAVVSTASMLASFKLNQAQVERLTPAVADVARLMNVDLVTAAQAVGRSVEGGTNAMRWASS